jgi:hypothetical protein
MKKLVLFSLIAFFTASAYAQPYHRRHHHRYYHHHHRTVIVVR